MITEQILIAIDETVGGTTTCQCGKELIPTEDKRAFWLECPVFVENHRLPRRIVSLLEAALHDRYLIAAQPAAA